MGAPSPIADTSIRPSLRRSIDLMRSHGTAVAEYRTRFGYNHRRALMCSALRRFYAKRAIEAGLAGRIRDRPIVDSPELRRLGGVRTISLEEQLTRQEARTQMAARQARQPRPAASPMNAERLAG
jgi:hypothetical protein